MRPDEVEQARKDVQDIIAFTRKLMEDKEKSRKFLIDGGFMTEDGKLHPRYWDENYVEDDD